jgi:hypothetical protein
MRLSLLLPLKLLASAPKSAAAVSVLPHPKKACSASLPLAAHTDPAPYSDVCVVE